MTDEQYLERVNALDETIRTEARNGRRRKAVV